MDLKEVLNDTIKNTMDNIFKDKENFMSFLSLVSRFPYLDYKNLLLLWKQSPNAKLLIANNKNYLEENKLNLTMAKKIAFLYPTLRRSESDKDLIEINYEPIQCYSFEDNEFINDLAEYPYDPKNLLEMLESDNFDVTIKDISESNLSENEYSNMRGFVDFFYDEKEMKDFKIIYLNKRELQNEKLFNAELITQYVNKECRERKENLSYFHRLRQDVFNRNYVINNKTVDFYDCLANTLAIIICKAFGVDNKEQSVSNIIGIGKIKGKYTEKEKAEVLEFRKIFLEELSFVLNEIFYDLLNRYYMTFYDSCFSKNFIHNDNKHLIEEDLVYFISHLTDDYIGENLERYGKKINFCTDEFVFNLNCNVKEKNFYMFPLYEYEFL